MTSAIAGSLQQLTLDLDRLGARWALIGGFAVSARAEPRFTHDVDVCVVVDSDEDAEQLSRALRGVGYSVASIVEHEYLDRLATVRLISPVPGGVPIDLLFASSGIEPEIVGSAERLEILPGLIAPVASSAHLVVLKLLAQDEVTRPQDGMDLRSLRPTLDADDESAIRWLAGLVTERGFNRDRDLEASVDAYLIS